MRSLFYIIANMPAKDLRRWRMNDENIVFFIFLSSRNCSNSSYNWLTHPQKKSKKAEMLGGGRRKATSEKITHSFYR